MHNEKLAAVGIWTGVGHGYSSSEIIPGDWLVGKFVTWSPTPVPAGVAALDHETLNYPVKYCIGIKSGTGKGDKVVDSNWRVLGIESDGNCACGGV